MLPEFNSWSGYRDLWRRESAWAPALEGICEQEGLASEGFRRILTDGTHIVWTRPGDLVIKLHCPFFQDSPVEQAVTRFMRNRLPVAVPGLVASGTLAGWPYTLLTWLPGDGLDEVWPGLNREQRVRLAAQFGELARAWHDASSDEVPIGESGWASFVDTRFASTVDLQRDTGLDQRFISQVLTFLEPFVEEFRSPACARLIHSDFKQPHILVAEQDGEWNITGLIDFGDAVVGHPEYDFVDATLSLYPPDRAVTRSFFDGYGELEKFSSAGGRERLLAWVLLHNDMGLTRFRPDAGWSAGARNLPELASQIWPT